MSMIRRKNEWLKEILMIEEGKERLQQHNRMVFCGLFAYTQKHTRT
jgi:hypothetical protein